MNKPDACAMLVARKAGKYSILISSLLWLLQGCSALSQHQTNPELPLLSPASGPASIQVQQRVKFYARGKHLTFLALVSNNHEQTRMLALWASGQPILELSYDGDHVQSRNFTDLPLPERDILAQIQYGLWPKSKLAAFFQALPDWELTLGEQRMQLRYKGQLWLNYQQEQGELSIEHLIHRYQLTIHALEADSP